MYKKQIKCSVSFCFPLLVIACSQTAQQTSSNLSNKSDFTVSGKLDPITLREMCIEDRFSGQPTGSYTEADIDAVCDGYGTTITNDIPLTPIESEIVEYLDASNASILRQDPSDFEMLSVSINKGISPYDVAAPIVTYSFDRVFARACSNAGMSSFTCSSTNSTYELPICASDDGKIIARYDVSFVNDEQVGYNGPPFPEYTLFINSGRHSENIRKSLAIRNGIDLNILDGATLPSSASRNFRVKNISDYQAQGYDCR